MAEPSAALHWLVQHAQLDDLAFLELTARRDADASAQDDAPVEPVYTLNAQATDDRRRFRLVLRIDIDVAHGEVHVAACAEYVVSEDAAHALTQRLVVEYANEVGVMAMLPYLRHAIADLTQRVFGEVLLMPVMPRGAVAFPLPEETDGG